MNNELKDKSHGIGLFVAGVTAFIIGIWILIVVFAVTTDIPQFANGLVTGNIIFIIILAISTLLFLRIWKYEL